MKEYAFDCTILSTIRIKAESEEAARKKLNDLFDLGVEANYGAIDGEPVVAMAEFEHGDEEPDLIEIDGEAV